LLEMPQSRPQPTKMRRERTYLGYETRHYFTFNCVLHFLPSFKLCIFTYFIMLNVLFIYSTLL
jgi:hypothetical protein